MSRRWAKRDCACASVHHKHGTVRAYVADRCGCEPCRRAWSRRLKVYRYRVDRGDTLTVSPVGVARRLQALAAVGWSAVDLAELLDTDKQNVAKWREGRARWVLPSTLERVSTVYDAVWDKQPPGRYAVKIRNTARRRGWHPPLAWDDESLDDPDGKPDPTVAALARPTVCPECGKRLSTFSAWRSHRTNLHGFIYQPAESEDGPEPAELDEIAVDLIMHGQLRVPANTHSPERLEAIRRLAADGMNDNQIGQRLHMKRDAVAQNRERHGIPSGRAEESAA